MTTATPSTAGSPSDIAALRHDPSRCIRAPRGSTITCKGWQQEAAMRMLMNNLDAEVAEVPADLIIYGGSGRAARTWPDFDRIVAALQQLENDETLLVQSGRAVGVIKTHPDAPRVLISNSMLVPHWANWDEFRRLEAMGLTMFGQMTAGSWIYIGTQGILQGTYETLGACARRHFGGSLKGRLVVTAGLGGMGGAQPLAVTMNDGVCLCAEVDQQRIDRRIETGYLDKWTDDLDTALEWVTHAKEAGEPLSVGLRCNIVDVLYELFKRKIHPDVLTDQTSAHDPLGGYVPNGVAKGDKSVRPFDGRDGFWTESKYQAMLKLRQDDPDCYVRESFRSMAMHVLLMNQLQAAGVVTFDYGNNLRGHAREAIETGIVSPKEAAFCDPFAIPGFVPEYIRPLFCEGQGPFRWVALSGDPKDIARTDRAVLDAFPQDEHLCRWIRKAGEKIAFQGLPARICWLGYGERAKMGLVFNDLVARGEISAPIVIGRDHLDCGSVASPNRETEAMKDGSDAIADWPILNAMVNTACGATWVSVHHGGGVGIGYSIHAGQVIVADGTPAAAERLQRVLTADPATGVMRHADAGYEKAIEVAKERGVAIPGHD